MVDVNTRAEHTRPDTQHNKYKISPANHTSMTDSGFLLNSPTKIAV